MIRSMTGYGSAKGVVAGIPLSVELRSVNNRYLDLNIRLPRGFLFAEESVKTLIQERVSRGKVDVFVNPDGTDGEQTRIRVNEPLAEAYLNALHGLSEKYGLSGSVSAMDLARFPEVLTPEKEDTDQELFLSGLRELLEKALSDFNAMRLREGEKLKADLLNKADRIEELVEEISQKAPETVAAYRARLEEKLTEVLADSGVREDRILAEAAVFADRVATDEELVRLRSHLSQLRGMLEQGSPVGRKLDFLIQEFNREANTTGSKCQDSGIAYLVVELKSEIEKIREQVQNIE